jgi:hypothetical protein
MSVKFAISQHIADRQEVEFRQAIATGAVQWKQNRPCQTESNKAYNAEDPEVAQEEETVERAVPQHGCIRRLDERYDPVEPA